MKRIVSVWLENWPMERLARADPRCVPEAHPFALVQTGQRGVRIYAVNVLAHEGGVRVGQALADARALLPGLMSGPALERADRRALLGLARWCGRYGPQRNREGDDGLWIDVTGVAHLFGGEAGLVEDLWKRLQKFGLTVRIGLADTPGAAYALARFAPMRADAPWRIAKAGEQRAALSDLPVEALRLTSSSVVSLRRLGLKRIGQLYDLPPAALARRFRSQGVRSSRGKAASQRAGAGRGAGEDVSEAVSGRLAQALGRLPEPRRGLREPPVLHVRRSWADPLISQEGIVSEVAGLAEELAEALRNSGVGFLRARLVLYRTDGTVGDVVVGACSPCADGDHLNRLLSERLRSIDAGFGIDVMVMEALQVHKVMSEQTALVDAGAAYVQTDVARLVDRLTGRLGRSSVYRLGAQASHLPERAQMRRPAFSRSRAVADVGSGFTSLPHCAPRPAFLLSSPEPIAVTAAVPEGAPVQFLWRRVSHRVVRAQGPERIAPEWWRLRSAEQPQPDDEDEAAASLGVKVRSRLFSRTRDYYVVEVSGGGRYWVFRDGLYDGDDGGDVQDLAAHPEWFLHGMF